MNGVIKVFVGIDYLERIKENLENQKKKQQKQNRRQNHQERTKPIESIITEKGNCGKIIESPEDGTPPPGNYSEGEKNYYTGSTIRFHGMYSIFVFGANHNHMKNRKGKISHSVQA